MLHRLIFVLAIGPLLRIIITIVSTNNTITTAFPRSGLAVEFLAYSVDKLSIEFLRDGLVVSGKCFGSGVLDAKSFGNL
jgi:hypothetical protein